MTNKTLSLSVLLLKEGESWVAQVLEHDIAAQGKTVSDATCSLRKIIAGQGFLDIQNGLEPLAGISAAPDYYRAMFENAEETKRTLHVPFMQKHYGSASANDVRVALA
jgi:hypothetical protein